MRGITRGETVVLLAVSAVLGLGVTELVTRTDLTFPLVAAAGIAVAVVALSRPLWACALFLGSSSVGNRDLPGAPFGLQFVHLMCGLAVMSVILGLISGGLTLPRGLHPAIKQLLAAMVLLIITVLASTVASVNPERSLRTALTFAAGLALVVAFLVVVRSPGDLQLLVSAFVIGSLPLSLRGIIEAGEAQAVYAGAVVKGRPSGDFSEPNALGLFCAMVVLTSLGLWLWSEVWKTRVVGLLGALSGTAAVGALAASLSRGAWLGLLVGLATFVVLYRPVVLTLLKTAAVGMIVLVPLGLLGLLSGLPSLVQQRLGTIIAGEENPYDVRPLTWAEAIREASLSPFIGNGPGTFAELSAQWPSVIQFYPRVHAHNGALTTVAELGILGLLSAFAVVVLVSVAVVRVPGRDALRVGLFAGLVAVGGHLLVDYPLRNPVLMLAVWGVLGMLVAAMHGGRRRTSDAAADEPAARTAVRSGSP